MPLSAAKLQNRATATVVPGHLAIAPGLAAIAKAQAEAPETERATWSGPGYRSVNHGGLQVHLYHERAIVPSNASLIKRALMTAAHDGQYHNGAVKATIHNLHRSAKVTWPAMTADVTAFIRSCARCILATDHEPPLTGTLVPTIPPHPFHTLYIDIKGRMPYDTGYILGVTDALSRNIWLRYLPKGTAKELIEEMNAVHCSMRTLPAVIRCDNGSPFNSDAFKAWCHKRRITLVYGVPYHSQGQGAIETRFRPLAHAIMATLGKKAPRDWCVRGHLENLELIMNSTYSEPLGGSPHYVLTGREPRTILSADNSWDDKSVAAALELPAGETLSYNDICNLVAEHIGRIRSVQGLLHIGTSVAQLVTKSYYDAKAKPNPFVVGSSVALHVPPSNRLEPRYKGPYIITALQSEGNIASLRHAYGTCAPLDGLYPVYRLIPFDMSRADPLDIADAQLDSDFYVPAEVLEHRTSADGALELHIRWFGSDTTTWQPITDFVGNALVNEYCSKHSIAAPVPAASKRRGNTTA